MKEIKKYICTFYFIFIFILIFLFKIYLFKDTALSTDQAFYSKWLSDIYATQHFFPTGSSSFFQNLLLDHHSFLHQFLIRLYNNFTDIFALFSLFVNYFLNLILTKFPVNFNIISIIANTLIPFLILIVSIKDSKIFRSKDFFLYSLLIFIVTFNFSFFYYAPLGVHNFGILFIILTLYFSVKNFEKDIFFDKYFVLFGVLIPIMCHSHNFIFITIYLFSILLYRKLFKNKYFFNKDLLIYFFCIGFFCIILLILFFFNYNNISFFKSIFSFAYSDSKFILLDFFKNQLINIKIWFMRIFHYFGIPNFIVLIIFILKFKNPALLIAIFCNFILFITLNLDQYYFSVILYNLIPFYFYFFKGFENFKISLQNNYSNIFIIITLIIGFFFQLYEIYKKKNLNISQLQFFNYYYKDTKIIENNFLLVFQKIDRNNVIFNEELAKNLYYSNLYSLKDVKPFVKNDFIVKSYYQRFYQKKFNDFAYFNFYTDIKKNNNVVLTDTYYLFFGYRAEDPLKELCAIMSIKNLDCANIKKIRLANFNENIQYGNRNFKMQLFQID
jgi:hypothetical protein